MELKDMIGYIQDCYKDMTKELEKVESGAELSSMLNDHHSKIGRIIRQVNTFNEMKVVERDISVQTIGRHARGQ